MIECTFEEIERIDGVGKHRCSVCGYERLSRYASRKIHHPCRGTPAEHAARRAAMLTGELAPSTHYLSPAEFIRLAVKQRWTTYPADAVRPLPEIEAEIQRQEAAGVLPSGCPDKLQRFITHLLCRPVSPISDAAPLAPNPVTG